MRCVNLLARLLGFLLVCGSTVSQGAGLSDPAWKYTVSDPGDGWESLSFDDSKWKEGAGGFGDASTPGSRVGTEWLTNDIWIRRNVELESLPVRPALYMHHDEDAVVFINGKRVSQVDGFVTEYKTTYGEAPDIFAALSYDAARLLLDALRHTDSQRGEDIRLALSAIEDFPGVTGQTTFDSNGDVVKPMGIKQVKENAFVWIAREYNVGGE